MTNAALTVLSRNPNGFVLLVEGGAVDWAAHTNNLNRTIGEQLDFDRAVQAVIDRYGIDYIVVGSAERNLMSELAGSDQTRLDEYLQGLDKFDQIMEPVCQFGSATVYRVGME